MLNPSSWLSYVRRPLIAAVLALGGPAALVAQDTIQSGTLRPLETLPSLGGPPGVPIVIPDFSPAAGAMPGLPPGAAPALPTISAPGLAPGSAPELPTLNVPGLPSAAPAAPPAPSLPAAADGTPPPLPTGGPLIIKEPLAQAYLYVEPYQTRFEVLFDAATMLAWLSPDMPAPQEITPELQKQLAEKAAARAAKWCELRCGDEALPVPQVQVSVIKGLPANTVPMKDDEAVAVNQAMLGFFWEFATPPAPADVVVMWNGWINGRTTLPIRVFFGTQSQTGEINATIKTYRWRNLDRLPRPAPLAAVPQREQPVPTRVPVGGLIWLLGGVIFYAYIKITNHKLPGGSLPFVAVWLLGAVLMSQLLVIPIVTGPATPAVTEVAEAQRIVSPLLRNVYRAFDHRAESDVYDVLERSVEGELLRRLYLETIQALTLEGREGTRVNITEFQVTVDKVTPAPAGEGFVADCNWMARGNVGHWGHTHSRLNIYNARLTLVPVKDEWKLTGLEVDQVRRL